MDSTNPHASSSQAHRAGFLMQPYNPPANAPHPNYTLPPIHASGVTTMSIQEHMISLEYDLHSAMLKNTELERSLRLSRQELDEERANLSVTQEELVHELGRYRESQSFNETAYESARHADTVIQFQKDLISRLEVDKRKLGVECHRLDVELGQTRQALTRYEEYVQQQAVPRIAEATPDA